MQFWNTMKICGGIVTLHMKQITNENPLHSSGNSARCGQLHGKESRWEGLDVHVWLVPFALQQKRTWHCKAATFVSAHHVGVLRQVGFFLASWTGAHQAPLPMGLPRQKSHSGLPFPSPGDLLHPGTEPASPVAPVPAPAQPLSDNCALTGHLSLSKAVSFCVK